MNIKEYIASSSIGFVFGILTTFLVELLKERRDIKDRQQAYLDSLSLAQHEITFYIERFNQLRESLTKYLPLAEQLQNTSVRPPGNFISSESFQKIKYDIGGVSNNTELMLCVSRCHADLSSIEWKMQIIEKASDHNSTLINLKSLVKQAEDAIKQFKLLDALLEQEINEPKMRKKNIF